MRRRSSRNSSCGRRGHADTGDRGFESRSLQRRVSCEPLRGSPPSAPAGTSSIAGGTQHQLMRAGLGFRGVTHVLLTHAHLDHVLGLAGLLATFALYRMNRTVEIIGSDQTVAFIRRYLAHTIGPERDGAYQLRAVSPGLVLEQQGWRLEAFAVAHRGTASLGYRFQDEPRRSLLPERL